MDKRALPLVSILIPTYNQPQFIEAAINSALEQDYQNLEIIVSDDCSDAKLTTIINQYIVNPKVKYFRNNKNIGRVANYKKCLYDYASGDWALCLDGDDYLTDINYVSYCIDIIKKYEGGAINIVFIQAGDQLIDELKNINRIRLPKIKDPLACLNGKDYVLNFHVYNHFSHLATLYDRKKAIASGFYMYDILSTDIESLLKLSLEGEIILLRKVVGVWRHHGSNVSASNNINLFIDNLNWIDRCAKYAQKKYPELRREFEKWSKKTFANSIISIVDIIRQLPYKGKFPFKKNKKLLKHLLLKRPSIFFNPRFLAHLFIKWGEVKKTKI